MRLHNEIQAYLNQLAQEPKNAAVLYADIEHTAAEGSGWARSYIDKHYNDETYQLQIDSHMRFYGDWDT